MGSDAIAGVHGVAGAHGVAFRPSLAAVHQNLMKPRLSLSRPDQTPNAPSPIGGPINATASVCRSDPEPTAVHRIVLVSLTA